MDDEASAREGRDLQFADDEPELASLGMPEDPEPYLRFGHLVRASAPAGPGRGVGRREAADRVAGRRSPAEPGRAPGPVLPGDSRRFGAAFPRISRKSRPRSAGVNECGTGKGFSTGEKRGSQGGGLNGTLDSCPFTSRRGAGALIALQRGMIGRQQALETGLGADSIDNLIRTGRWHRVHRGGKVGREGRAGREAAEGPTRWVSGGWGGGGGGGGRRDGLAGGEPAE